VNFEEWNRRERHLAHVLCEEIFLRARVLSDIDGQKHLSFMFPKEHRFHLAEVGQGFLVYPTEVLNGMMRKEGPGQRPTQRSTFPLSTFFYGTPSEFPPPDEEEIVAAPFQSKKDKRGDFEIRKRGVPARTDMATYEVGGEHTIGHVLLQHKNRHALMVELKSMPPAMGQIVRGKVGGAIIEYWCRGEPSGISTTEADVWAIEWWPSCWLLTWLDDLRWQYDRALSLYGDIPCGEYKNGQKVARGVRVPLIDLLQVEV